MKEFKFDYDKENDDLFIYLEGAKSKGAVEIGNLVIDFDENENLVGLEIFEASEILSKFLSRVIELSKIKGLEAEATDFRNMASIKLKITTDNFSETTNIVLPRIIEQSPALNY